MAPTSRKKNNRRSSSGKRKKPIKAEPIEEEDEAIDLSSDSDSEPVVKKKIPPRASQTSRSKSAPPQRKEKKSKEKKSKEKKSKEKDSKEKDSKKESKTRSPRRKVTIETHLEKYDKLLELLNEHIDHLRKNKEPGSRVFTTIRKAVRELHKEAPKIANSRRKPISNNQNKVSGFVLQCQLSPELTDFLQVNHDTTLCRRDVTNAICVYSHLKPDEEREHMLRWEYLNPKGKRNLQNPKERMAIVPDSSLAKLLRYNKYKKDVKAGHITKNVKDKKTQLTTTVTVTEPTLYYWVIQKLLSVHYVATLKNKAESIDVD
uniref:SWIB/MDM2 domain-containing protein n=1 Tax=Marseillevirus LCMAC101 TaxID=2506602 RepID=A0A481YR04_9VIRU|nr:MAG: SWIB/MDM2 domain-containing protein [Marseillevirus LCMAC101]